MPRWLICVLICSVLATGCNSKSGDSTASSADEPDWVKETPGDESKSGDDDKGHEKGHQSSKAVASADEFDEAPLELKLKPGDRFPLRKIVEQELTQNSERGPEVSRSRLELMLEITVGEKENEKTEMKVKYNHVKYSHNVAGQQVEFDSRNPPARIPEAVRPYAAMVKDGFSFWIGSDNRIASVDGFQDFLERCMKAVPESHRQNVTQFIEASAGEGGISNFVDNSIGLMPYGNRTAIGEQWKREEHVGRPVPMLIETAYTVKDLSKDYAVVDIHGTVVPSTSAHPREHNLSGARITVMGGTVEGFCTLFRDSGLPKESKVIRDLEMNVQLSGGITFKQNKRVTTTVESFPGAARTASNSDNRGRVQQISGEEPERPNRRKIRR